MKYLTSILLAFALFVPRTEPAPIATVPSTSIIPTFSIINVVPGSTITIRAYDFPAQDSFDVLMGPMGTRGINGIKVTTISSGNGGSFTKTIEIPDNLKGSYQIAIRLQSNSGSGYFAYNWFYNNTEGGSPGTYPGTGDNGADSIPTFTITNVIRDQTVNITTRNFPKNDIFDVLMGNIGTRGINGIKTTTVPSRNGGEIVFTFDIPNAQKGQSQIAIRLQSNTGSGYFAYNWFYNKTGGGTDLGGTHAPPVYTGFPIFFIANVVTDKTITIVAHNLPPHDQFKVLMGPMGTRGISGYRVTTIDTGTGGRQTLTFNIPVELKGSDQISIRLQSTTGSGYYAHNWFYNNTT